jgi:hypothetical protein
MKTECGDPATESPMRGRVNNFRNGNEWEARAATVFLTAKVSERIEFHKASRRKKTNPCCHPILSPYLFRTHVRDCSDGGAEVTPKTLEAGAWRNHDME